MVDGEKVFITSGVRADWITVAVRTDLKNKGPMGISMLMVPGDAVGLSRSPLKKMGWLCSDTAQIRFDGVRVPASNLVGEEGSGFKIILTNFNGERLSMAAMALGFSECCYDEALSWAQQRKTFGTALIDHQVIRHKLMDMKMRIESTRAWLNAVSARAGKPFISVNMGGLPEGVFESELFGHVRGAFTDAKVDRAGRFELADSGTLFMDEIGNIPMSQQAKILRTLETGEFERVGSSRTSRTNVRLISATNSDLNAEVAAGKFRQDLLFRLNTIHLHLPPLRERREDIPLLAQHFLKAHVTRYNKPITGFDDGALEAMKNYAWPGNVRELDHSVERGVLMTQGKVVRAPDLGLNAGQSAPRLDDMSLEEVEAFLIKKTLARCDGNARQAAEELGLSRSAFYRRLERYKL